MVAPSPLLRGRAPPLASLLLLDALAAAVVVTKEKQHPRVQDENQLTGIPLHAPCSPTDFAAKDFDLVIYGSTGFMGRRAAEYLANGHPDLPRWGLAGRNEAKLNKAYYELRKNPVSAPGGIIVATVNDPASLYRMALRAKTILNFAGPYEYNHAEDLVRASIEGCSNYVDLATDTPWLQYIVKKYDHVALGRGVGIVQSAGFYATAADYTALQAARDAYAYNGKRPPGEVMVVWSKLNQVLGGTQKIAIAQSKLQHGTNFDPYALAPQAPQELKVDREPDGFSSVNGLGQIHGLDQRMGMVLLPYDGAGADCTVIRRSMQKTFDAAPIVVRESKNQSLDDGYFAFKLDPRTVAATARRPEGIGTGPSAWMQAHGSWAAVGYGMSSAGDAPLSLVKVEGMGEPGSFTAPRIAVEVALGLTANGPADGQGGYLTPATAMPLKELRRRLTAQGIANITRMTVAQATADAAAERIKPRRDQWKWKQAKDDDW